MHSVASAFYELKGKLTALYDDRESAAIAHEIVECITGLGKIDRLMHKERLLADDETKRFDDASVALLKGIPLQYVTGEAWFMGSRYCVNNNVLIPRPETEELVQWIVDDTMHVTESLKILDIGTGSGCIPVSLKKLLPHAHVSSCDVSPGAIDVAKRNAESLNADIKFIEVDFLDESAHFQLGNYDIIVSNPPYIPMSEKQNLHINVAANEPGIALFVPDDDALVFYRAIAAFGKKHLNQSGRIYCELDAGHATETAAMFGNAGYKNVILRKDMHGNNRMLRVDFF